MAQFRGTLEGSGSQISRLGGKSSGVSASVNGWNVGFDIRAFYDEDAKQDVVMATLSGGSNGNHKLPDIHITANESSSYRIQLNNKIIAEKGNL